MNQVLVNQVLNVLQGIPYHTEVVGSTAILGQGEDIDVAFLVDPQYKDHIIGSLRAAGWVGHDQGYEGVELETDQFNSLKREDINLLFCWNAASYDRFVQGMQYAILAQELGMDMSNKAHRVLIHAIYAREPIDSIRARARRLGWFPQPRQQVNAFEARQPQEINILDALLDD